MVASKIRRAIGHVKDQTSISLAKVGSSSSISDLEVAIVKATEHEEYPAEERHVREILSLTSYSRERISACVKTLSKRLNKTRNWTIFFSSRRGTRILNMSDFRDTSQSNSWDFSSFVRTYALYLDERLDTRRDEERPFVLKVAAFTTAPRPLLSLSSNRTGSAKCKLHIINEFILEKSALEQAKGFRDDFGSVKETEASEEEEEDVNAIKALLEPEPEKLDNSKALVVVENKGDLLNLEDEAISSQDYGDKLELALFGDSILAAAAPSSVPGWEAFKDDSDWESALVQSASYLKNQRATLGGGFDLLLLDSMYQQGNTMAAMASSGYVTTGSASTVAFGSARRPAILALPAPPSSNHKGINVVDPFAASLAVEPPSYLQMSNMGKKQWFLVEQNRRDGMQGYGAMPKVHNYPYSPVYSPWHGY
ncbi:Vacuolar iron transporter family protein [Hibiscus syriacus]|uniref:Vacuolar iron transporter family protein n=1 Tax=Hibiscus syriacus TaxID=106335 RepID=A0A6A2Y597_HIBSY|nr:Vacuolar iron transporter family protein [Hibiscus syriacus]